MPDIQERASAMKKAELEEMGLFFLKRLTKKAGAKYLLLFLLKSLSCLEPFSPDKKAKANMVTAV